MLHQSNTDSLVSGRDAMTLREYPHPVRQVAGRSDLKALLQPGDLVTLADLMMRLQSPAGKNSFLVFKNNKYINILTRDIAFFYVRYNTTSIVTFDRHEYFVNHSLEELQHLLHERYFFRVNRQYLVSFAAIKEAEHYFARKLLVNLVVPTKDKLLISKEKSSAFLHWLDER